MIKKSVCIMLLMISLACFAQENSDIQFYSIHDINQGNLKPGIYRTEGFVVKIYNCPSCPEGAKCKPCMKDNIVISENSRLLGKYNLTDNELIIFVKNDKHFELGKKYRFLIHMLNYSSTTQSINDIELIEYELIE